MPRIPIRFRLIGALVAILLAGTASAVRAQRIAGAVVDSGSGLPVGRGFVVLLDGSGRELARTLTDRQGRFMFVLATAGRYRLRSERIAYRVWESDWLELAADESRDVTLRILPVPIRLDAIEVESETQCRLRPEEGRNTAALWDEAQKALRAASWSAQHEVYTHTIHRYSRDLDVRRRRVENETTSTVTEAYRSPFRSLPAERLVKEGYITHERDGTWYHAPDANTLLDDSFVASHCFRAVRDRDRAGMVGLEFSPTPDRKLPDVRGVLWIDEASSELRSLEYSYEHLPNGISDQRIGGTVQFLAMPTGAWIVHKWQIRMPELARVRPRDYREPDSFELGGFRDTGGTITRITDRNGAVVYQSPDVVLVTGTVLDSGSLRPIAAATVELRGTGYEAVTDVLGRYRLSALLDGEYEVEFTHPRLDSLAFFPEPRSVDLRPGDSVRVDLFLPPEPVIVRTLCPDAMDPSAPVIVGMVRSPTNGRGVGGVPIVASWQDAPRFNEAQVLAAAQRIETESDVWGGYVLCDLPMERTVAIEAARDSVVKSLMTVRMERNRVLMSPGIIHRSPLEGFYRSGPIWTVDLILLPDRCYDRRTGEGITETIATCDVTVTDVTRLPPRRRRR